MFRASLCPSSGEQDRVLPHMVFCAVTREGKPERYESRSGLSQHVLGISMPIIRRTRPRTNAYGVLRCNKRGKNILRFFPLLLQRRTPYAVAHGLVLLMMGIMMPETC